MVSPGAEEFFTCPPRPVRVALALRSEGNRRLLEGFLGQACERFVINSVQDVRDREYDVCFLDASSLVDLRDAIEERQADCAPLVVPHLLLTPRDDVTLITREIWRVVDSIIVTPVEPVVLAAHFAAAWRLRELSLICFERSLDNREAASRLEERVAMFRKQLRGFAHDIRNPVNAIVGFARLLSAEMAGPLTEEQRVQIGMIEQAGSSLLRIADTISVLARSGEAAWVSAISEVDVSQLKAHVVPMFRRLAVGKGLSFTTTVEPGLVLWTDAGLLERILENLLSNAVKYTVEGGISVEARSSELDTVAFSVRDTGLGISVEDQKRLFEERFRSASVASEVEGLGLGLSLVKAYAEALGGSVSFASQLGKGSTFTVTLPKRQPSV
ncbi:MAG: HAMP domain-containing sensor histidine kinase [Anaerosomatales bacterium]|nr:HAMP domain-containing sensor histidine kinase [Anaerosomatales bacterium]